MTWHLYSFTQIHFCTHFGWSSFLLYNKAASLVECGKWEDRAEVQIQIAKKKNNFFHRTLLISFLISCDHPRCIYTCLRFKSKCKMCFLKSIVFLFFSLFVEYFLHFCPVPLQFFSILWKDFSDKVQSKHCVN